MTVKIGEKIRDLRKKADVTQEKFAEYLGVSAQAVSKWEVEGCYPDLELLAPIANFFDVTIDELMGFDKSKEQAEIKEYINRSGKALFSAGNAKEAVATMREANAKYPGKSELMKNLADLLYDYATTEPDEVHKQNTFREVISLGEKIRSECKDDKTRREVLRVICASYKRIGEREKALKLANENLDNNLWTSDVILFTVLLDGDELVKQQQTNMISMMQCSCDTMHRLSKDFAPEDRLAIYKTTLDMYFMIFKDRDFHYYGSYIAACYTGIADAYIELKDNAKALENLKNAADYTIAFDQRVPFAPYTSPLVNKVPSVGQTWEAGRKGNHAYYFLKGFGDEKKGLGDEKYDPIRDTPEFGEICKNLEKHAVENIYL